MAGLGQAACHQGDHGPQDHGFVAGREAFVVADSAAVLADPGEGPLHDPPAGQDLEGVRLAPGDDLEVHLQGRGPAGELAGVNGLAEIRRTRWLVRCRFHSSGRAASRSWTEAAVITTASSRPIESTAMCRLRPFTFFALSHPRVALGTVSAARTDWESMIAAVGAASRPRRPGPGRAARRAAGPGCRHRARRRSTRTPSARAGSPRGGTARRTRRGPGTRSPRRSGAAARPAAAPAARAPQAADAGR